MADRGTLAQWATIAGDFPATLVRDIAPEYLKDGQTPDSYGLGIDRPGYLYAEPSVSTGTYWDAMATVSTPTDTPISGSQTWRYWHNRLWGWPTSWPTVATTDKVYYGAAGYDTDYLIDGLGYFPLNDATEIVYQVVPFGPNMAVFTTDNLYIVRNAAASGYALNAEHVRQAGSVNIPSDVVSVDGVLYWANTRGIFAYDGQNVRELTQPVRSSLAPFSYSTVRKLYANFDRHRIVGLNASDATAFIIEPGEQVGLYDYSTSGFRFTTRTLAGKEGEPLVIDKVAFTYQYSGTTAPTIGLDVKINDTWKTDVDHRIQFTQDNGRSEAALDNMLACRRFALRVRSMTSGLYVSQIMVHVKQGGVWSYSGK